MLPLAWSIRLRASSTSLSWASSSMVYVPASLRLSSSSARGAARGAGLSSAPRGARDIRGATRGTGWWIGEDAWTRWGSGAAGVPARLQGGESGGASVPGGRSRVEPDGGFSPLATAAVAALRLRNSAL